MNIPIPAEIALFDEIIDELNDFVLNKPSDEMTVTRVLRGIEEKVRTLKGLNLATGFSAQGSLRCAQGDIQGMHESHLVSLRYERSFLTHHNYAASLYNCGDDEGAFAYSKVAYDIDPTEVGNLSFLIEVCAKTNKDVEMLRYAVAWEKLTGKPHELYLAYLEVAGESDALTKLCADTTIDAFSDVWNTPEEDEAWAHLQ